MQDMRHNTEETASPNASQRTLADTTANENGSKRIRNKEEASPLPAQRPAIDPYLVYFKVSSFTRWKPCLASDILLLCRLEIRNARSISHYGRSG